VSGVQKVAAGGWVSGGFIMLFAGTLFEPVTDVLGRKLNQWYGHTEY
jgi:hypothetical protein